jgi:hypothetical protein
MIIMRLIFQDYSFESARTGGVRRHTYPFAASARSPMVASSSPLLLSRLFSSLVESQTLKLHYCSSTNPSPSASYRPSSGAQFPNSDPLPHPQDVFHTLYFLVASRVSQDAFHTGSLSPTISRLDKFGTLEPSFLFLARPCPLL